MPGSYNQKLQVFPDHLDLLILATVCLHNFLRDDDENLWQPEELDAEDEVSGLQHLPRIGGNAANEAFTIRENFKNYFNSAEGRVVWQDEMVHRGRINIPT